MSVGYTNNDTKLVETNIVNGINNIPNLSTNIFVFSAYQDK